MCSENAVCNNTDGNYSCECKEGYEGDGFHCTGVCPLKGYRHTVFKLTRFPQILMSVLVASMCVLKMQYVITLMEVTPVSARRDTKEINFTAEVCMSDIKLIEELII